MTLTNREYLIAKWLGVFITLNWVVCAFGGITALLLLKAFVYLPFLTTGYGMWLGYKYLMNLPYEEEGEDVL